MHFSNVHFVLCQIFGLHHLTPPVNAFFFPLLSIASTLSELKWAITSPKKGQAMQRCHAEHSARSKGARLSPLDHNVSHTSNRIRRFSEKTSGFMLYRFVFGPCIF